MIGEKTARNVPRDATQAMQSWAFEIPMREDILVRVSTKASLTAAAFESKVTSLAVWKATLIDDSNYLFLPTWIVEPVL